MRTHEPLEQLLYRHSWGTGTERQEQIPQTVRPQEQLRLDPFIIT